MTNAFDVKILSVPLYATDWGGDDVSMNILKAPVDGEGGGITLLRAWAVNDAATGAGTGFALALHNYDTGGSAIKTTGGTIAAAVGGTADPWVKGVPKEFTLSYPFIDAGEWVVLEKTEENSNDPTRGVLMIEYVMGK